MYDTRSRRLADVVHYYKTWGIQLTIKIWLNTLSAAFNHWIANKSFFCSLKILRFIRKVLPMSYKINMWCNLGIIKKQRTSWGNDNARNKHHKMNFSNSAAIASQIRHITSALRVTNLNVLWQICLQNIHLLNLSINRRGIPGSFIESCVMVCFIYFVMSEDMSSQN